MNERILLVDDEPLMLASLKAIVDYGGFKSESVSTGLEAIDVLRESAFDAMILDLGLPDLEGGELLRAVRGYTHIPVIVISGQNSDMDRVRALDAGADDFVPKPFLPIELIARLRAALRRSREPTHAGRAARDARPVQPLLLSSEDQSAEFAGRSVQLTNSQFRIMQRLLAEPGEIVSREAVLEALGAGSEMRDARLADVHISHLRQKLRDLLRVMDPLVSHRGRGWRLKDLS